MPMSGGASPAPSALCPHNPIPWLCPLDSNIGFTRAVLLFANHPQRLQNLDYGAFTHFVPAKHVLKAGRSLLLNHGSEKIRSCNRFMNNPG
jgi:hypothetical protein